MPTVRTKQQAFTETFELSLQELAKEYGFRVNRLQARCFAAAIFDGLQAAGIAHGEDSAPTEETPA